MLALISALVAFSLTAYLAGTASIVPHIVEVDREGKVLASYSGQNLQSVATENVIRAFIADWISNMRGVTVDRSLQELQIRRLESQLRPDDTAIGTVSRWFAENPPFERAARETVSVEMRDMRRVSSKSWYVRWAETARERNGNARRVTNHSATLTVEQMEVRAETAMLNPLGLYVRQLDLETTGEDR